MKSTPIMLLFVALMSTEARAQDSTAFVDLKPDGSGLVSLRAHVQGGVASRMALAAFTSVAIEAHISITLETTHPNFQTVVTIAPHDRSAAMALLEIAQACDARVLVSLRGQIVISPNEHQRKVVAEVPPAPAPAKAAVSLPQLHVEATRMERTAFDATPYSSTMSIGAEALRATPMFVEPDVLRSVQLLPGIMARSDWAAGFNVRGGEADQSLIMLDGYPIYNPFHLGGVFSTFIDPAVGNVELHTGGLPARLGGRLSGALDVSSAQPTESERHGTGEVSLMSAMGTLGQTFDDGSGSWIIGARRTYADMVVDLYQHNGFPYHFTDVQMHATRRLDAETRLSGTVYVGDDGASGDGTNAPYGGWGNAVVGLTLAHRVPRATSLFGVRLGDSVSAEMRASYTRFWAVADVSGYRSRVNDDVTDLRLAGSVTAHRGQSATTLGYEVSSVDLRYQAASIFSGFGDLFPIDSTGGRVNATALYISNLSNT